MADFEQEHGTVAMGDTEAALEKALDAYWNVAYQQGQETRGHDDEHGTAQKAEDGLRAAIAALSRPAQEPVAVPDGWQLVPIEPTREMWAAMANTLYGYKNRHHDKVAGDLYSAMLSAAPQPVINPAHSQVASTPGLLTDPAPADLSRGPADQIIGQIEELFPNWRSYRDLVDCITCELHELRQRAEGQL